MSLQFYNTLHRKKEEFKELEKGKIGIYTCGPTVYNFVHIGNLRAYVFNDLLKRYLLFKGYDVNHVMNITDVDDKTIRDSQKEGKRLTAFTEHYTEEFLKDLSTLHILPPTTMPKATDHVEEMIAIIQKLKDNGYTYEKEGSTYFRIQGDSKYGELAQLDLEGLKENADGRLNQDEYEKEDARDFALWKAYEKDDGDVYWDTPLGKGRPGWHIECSAMSCKHLGETFDIHCGGVDLIFPHHTNEIAQSENASGKKFVNYWLHNAHLIVNGEKMSKSLGNFYTLRDLLGKGYDATAIRYQLLSTHYRAQLNFTEDALSQIPGTLHRFKEFITKVRGSKGEEETEAATLSTEALTEFENAMDDDLNISEGLAVIFTYMTSINKILAENGLSEQDKKNVLETMQKFDSVLGVMDFSEDTIPEEVMELAKQREEARIAKDFSTADSLRDQIDSLGYVVKDEKNGFRIEKK